MLQVGLGSLESPETNNSTIFSDDCSDISSFEVNGLIEIFGFACLMPSQNRVILVFDGQFKGLFFEINQKSIRNSSFFSPKQAYYCFWCFESLFLVATNDSILALDFSQVLWTLTSFSKSNETRNEVNQEILDRLYLGVTSQASSFCISDNAASVNFGNGFILVVCPSLNAIEKYYLLKGKISKELSFDSFEQLGMRVNRIVQSTTYGEAAVFSCSFNGTNNLALIDPKKNFLQFFRELIPIGRNKKFTIEHVASEDSQVTFVWSDSGSPQIIESFFIPQVQINKEKPNPKGVGAKEETKESSESTQVLKGNHFESLFPQGNCGIGMTISDSFDVFEVEIDISNPWRVQNEEIDVSFVLRESLDELDVLKGSEDYTNSVEIYLQSERPWENAMALIDPDFIFGGHIESYSLESTVGFELSPPIEFEGELGQLDKYIALVVGGLSPLEDVYVMLGYDASGKVFISVFNSTENAFVSSYETLFFGGFQNSIICSQYDILEDGDSPKAAFFCTLELVAQEAPTDSLSQSFVCILNIMTPISGVGDGLFCKEAEMKRASVVKRIGQNQVAILEPVNRENYQDASMEIWYLSVLNGLTAYKIKDFTQNDMGIPNSSQLNITDLQVDLSQESLVSFVFVLRKSEIAYLSYNSSSFEFTRVTSINTTELCYNSTPEWFSSSYIMEESLYVKRTKNTQMVYNIILMTRYGSHFELKFNISSVPDSLLSPMPSMASESISSALTSSETSPIYSQKLPSFEILTTYLPFSKNDSFFKGFSFIESHLLILQYTSKNQSIFAAYIRSYDRDDHYITATIAEDFIGFEQDIFSFPCFLNEKNITSTKRTITCFFLHRLFGPLASSYAIRPGLELRLLNDSKAEDPVFVNLTALNGVTSAKLALQVFPTYPTGIKYLIYSAITLSFLIVFSLFLVLIIMNFCLSEEVEEPPEISQAV